ANGKRHAGRRLEGQRRSAITAEAAIDMVGRTETLAFAARPGEGRLARGDERRIEIPERLLAHAAMADRRLIEHALHMKPNGTALAAARIDRLVVEAHARSPSGLWQTASILLPSGSMTKAP